MSRPTAPHQVIGSSNRRGWAFAISREAMAGVPVEEPSAI
jgi:hypothetical protein